MRISIKPNYLGIFLLLIFPYRASSQKKSNQVCSGQADVKIAWPHPGLIQPLMIVKIGVRASISGLLSGNSYHAYLHLFPDQDRSHYKEFVWTEPFVGLTFELPQQLADGPIQLRVQVFSAEGCLEASDWVNGTVKRDMGLTRPACPACIFTTGWASEHFAQWDLLLSAGELPPLPPRPDVLEVRQRGLLLILRSHALLPSYRGWG